MKLTFFSLEQQQLHFVPMFQYNYNCCWDLFWNMVQFYSVLNVLVGGCRANYCFDKQSHGYTFLFAQTLRPIAPSNAFLFFTGSLLIFKSFNSCMQATLNFATLQWIRNFWTHWLIDDAVDLMSVELFWCSPSKTVFSEIGPSRSVLLCIPKTHCVANVE